MLNETKRTLTPRQIAAMRRKGYTLRAIAERSGISRERVRQILAKQGIAGWWRPAE